MRRHKLYDPRTKVWKRVLELPHGTNIAPGLGYNHLFRAITFPRTKRNTLGTYMPAGSCSGTKAPSAHHVTDCLRAAIKTGAEPTSCGSAGPRLVALVYDFLCDIMHACDITSSQSEGSGRSASVDRL